jgi:hypothetical protein
MKGGESMAVSAAKLTSALVIKLRIGVDGKGNDVFKNITFKNVKTSASEQDLFDVAEAIAAVLGSPVEGIFRQNLDELISQ